MEGLKLGAVDFISKPFHLEMVKEKVKTQLELKTYRDHLEDMINERTEKIQNLLHEKDFLLKEVHHQVKNNMSTISGILALQSKFQKNQEAKNALHDVSSRMMSMTVLYNKLYHSEYFGLVAIKGYLTSLVNEIAVTFFDRLPPIKIGTNI